LSYLGKLALRHQVDIAARAQSAGQSEQLADRFEGEAELEGASNEGQVTCSPETLT
jgi:hypothetical protein